MKQSNNANGLCVTPSMVRTISRYAEPDSQFKVHPAQAASWEMCGLMVCQVTVKPEELPSFDIIKEQPRTMAGVPLIVDADQPIDTVRLVNPNGHTIIAEITGLAVPTGFIL